VWRLARERLSQRQPTDIEVVLQELEAVGLWSDRFASTSRFFRARWMGFANAHEKGHARDRGNGLADLLARDAQTTFGEFAEWSRRLAEAIYDEVVACYGTVDSGAAADLYRGLLGVMDQFDVTDPIRTVPFFTLNYDIAVEHAVEALNLGLVDGFDRGLAGRNGHLLRTRATSSTQIR